MWYEKNCESTNSIEIDLSDNNLKTMKTENFLDPPVSYLNLANNKMEKIDRDSLLLADDNLQLKTLILDDNMITKINDI